MGFFVLRTYRSATRNKERIGSDSQTNHQTLFCVPRSDSPRMDFVLVFDNFRIGLALKEFTETNRLRRTCQQPATKIARLPEGDLRIH